MTSFTLATRWRVAATIEEVAAILSAPERLPLWWPEVYLSAEIVARGGADGLGRTVLFHTRGWLPYSLRWQARLSGSDRPHGWTVEATGDLVGRGTWRLEQRGDIALVGYLWRVRVEKPGLKQLAPLLRPLYAANHRWAMARGFEGLTRELARRRAGTLSENRDEARPLVGDRAAGPPLAGAPVPVVGVAEVALDPVRERMHEVAPALALAVLADRVRPLPLGPGLQPALAEPPERR
jgi:hypothetical protein